MKKATATTIDPRRVFINVNSYGADVGQKQPDYFKTDHRISRKISKVPLFIGQTGKNARAGLLERLRLLAWGIRSSFQERFPSVAQIRNDYAEPEFVINCNDFDEPNIPNVRHARCCRKSNNLTFSLPILCCFGEANSYEKIDLSHRTWRISKNDR